MNEPIPYTQPGEPSDQPANADYKPVKHECHCAPDAPCRLSGKCKCIGGLQKMLENIEAKDGQ